MAELVQVMGAVAIIPLVALSVLAWGHAMFGSSRASRRKDERQGAVMWTVASLAVAGSVVATVMIRGPQEH